MPEFTIHTRFGSGLISGQRGQAAFQLGHTSAERLRDSQSTHASKLAPEDWTFGLDSWRGIA